MVHRPELTVRQGTLLDEARGAIILVHGRGDSADGIMALADLIPQPDFAYLAPQASGNMWYPFSFLAPLAQNEPGLSSGIQLLGILIGEIQAAGVPARRTVLVGFSQGACLVSEFVARNPQRFGGLAALSGGLIGNREVEGVSPPEDKR